MGNILICEKCGLNAFSLRAIGDNLSRMYVCGTCYDRAGDDAATMPTLPALPAMPNLPKLPDIAEWPTAPLLPEPTKPTEIEIALPGPMQPVADEWSGCTPEPNAGEWCAAGYLAYLEMSGMSFIPLGDVALCPAHWRAILDDVLQQYPKLGMEPWKLPQFARILADTYMTAAITIADRIAMRQGR